MKNHPFLIYVFMLMNFINAMAAFVFSGILDQVAISLNISIASTGLLSTAYALGAAIGVPIVLIVFAKANRKQLMVYLLVLTILSTVGVVSASNFTLLLIFRVLMGVTGNAYGILAVSTVVSMSTKERQGRSLALLIMGNSLALVVGIPLTRALSSILDWRSIFWILNGLTLFATIYFVMYLPNPKLASKPSSIKEELKFLKSPVILSIFAYTFIMFTGYASFYVFATPYLLERFSSLESLLSIILVFFGLATFIGNYLGGQISDKIGYSKSMWVGALLQLFGILGIILSRNSMILSIVFIIFWLMSAWLTGLQTNVGIMQETHSGASFILSLTGTAIQFGLAIGSSISMVVINAYGLSSIVFITLITASLTLVLQSLVLRSK